MIAPASDWPELGAAGRTVTPVSVVVPVLDGVDFLEQAASRLVRVLGRCSDSYEIVFVDDGSSDGTWPAIVGACDSYAGIRGVRLRRNVGQAAAIAAGFSTVAGEVVATIDVDLEAYPEDLPLLLAAVSEGADLASGHRTGPRGWSRGMPSRVFNAHVRRSGIPLKDLGCGMNAMTAQVAEAYVAHGSIRRALPKSLLVSLADVIVEVPVRSVRSGTSRLGFRDLVNFWIEFDAMHGQLADDRFAWLRRAMSKDVEAGAPTFEIVEQHAGRAVLPVSGHRPE